MYTKGLLILLLTAFVITTTNAQTYYISTIAGNGTQGYSGDGGPATSAELTASQVALDASGNVYFADDNQIRKITAGTGIITTIAGNGTTGYSGDGGPATSAALFEPAGVAVDDSGNVYIADYENQRIRKVTASTGIITTIAGTGTAGYSGDGGATTSAALNGPLGVAVDASGNVYIADYSNQRIRKVTAGAGIITTIAGTGTAGYSGDGSAATLAELYGPTGVAVDALGNIYIIDLYDRIRKVTVSTGIITTIAGTGTGGYSGDGGPATSAEFYDPSGVAVDASGNVYFADDSNRVIRKITASTGVITTIAGTGTWGYSGDGGPATSAELKFPSGVAVDASGNVYFADAWNNRIRKLSLSVPTTGVTSSSSTDGYNVYPNPFSNLTTLVFNSSNTEPVNLTITDSKGVVVFTSTAYTTNSEIVIGSQLPSVGIYFVQASSGTGVKVVKLIKTE